MSGDPGQDDDSETDSQMVGVMRPAGAPVAANVDVQLAGLRTDEANGFVFLLATYEASQSILMQEFVQDVPLLVVDVELEFHLYMLADDSEMKIVVIDRAFSHEGLREVDA